MGIGFTNPHTSILERLGDGWQSIINYGDMHKIYLLAVLQFWVQSWPLFKRPNQAPCTRDYNAQLHADYNAKYNTEDNA